MYKPTRYRNRVPSGKLSTNIQGLFQSLENAQTAYLERRLSLWQLGLKIDLTGCLDVLSKVMATWSGKNENTLDVV